MSTLQKPGNPVPPGVYSRNGYTVTIKDDGSIVVKAGDWISKYSVCLYGDAKVGWEDFGRKADKKGEPKPLDDPNKIAARETLYHIPTHTKAQDTAKRQVRDQILATHLIVKRATWGATGPWKPLTENWNYTDVVVHHSGNWGEKKPKSIESKHKNKGFQDVGYHYLIHPNGTIYEGREILYKGEHVAGANTNKIGILMMGDYNEQWWDPDDDLSTSHLAKLMGLVRTLKKRFPLTKLGGHKEFLPGKGYTCPGNLLMDQMAKLRKALSLKAP